MLSVVGATPAASSSSAARSTMSSKWTVTLACSQSGCSAERWISSDAFFMRSLFERVPNTKSIESITFDLPDPFGPTTAENDLWKGPITRRLAYDLKFSTSRCEIQSRPSRGAAAAAGAAAEEAEEEDEEDDDDDEEAAAAASSAVLSVLSGRASKDSSLSIAWALILSMCSVRER